MPGAPLRFQRSTEIRSTACSSLKLWKTAWS